MGRQGPACRASRPGPPQHCLISAFQLTPTLSPESPSLWLQPSSLCSLVSAFHVCLSPQAPRTQTQGEVDVPAGMAGSCKPVLLVGPGPLQLVEPPRWGAACPSLSQGAPTPFGPRDASRLCADPPIPPSPGLSSDHSCLHSLSFACSTNPGRVAGGGVRLPVPLQEQNTNLTWVGPCGIRPQ